MSIFHITQKPVFFPGFTHGLRHRSLVFGLSVSVPRDEALIGNVLEKTARGLQLSLDPRSYAASEHGVIQFFFDALLENQKAAQSPVFESGKIIQDATEHQRDFIFAIPVSGVGHMATFLLARSILEMIESCYAGRDISSHIFSINHARATLRGMNKLGLTQLAILQAAWDMNVPILGVETSGNIIQLGYGSNSFRLLASIPDDTSALAFQLAGNKLASSNILNSYGIPCPTRQVVTSEGNAVDCAEQLGYPVVLKPSGSSQGRSVFSDLRNAEQVKASYALIKKELGTDGESSIVIEKHLDGADYRIVINKGKFLSATRRDPSCVTGDGTSTVRELLDRLNAEPDRGTDELWSILMRVEPDEEALSCIAKQGLAWESIPPEGQVVALRTVANVSRGAVPVQLAREEIHPDNIDLAIRATNVLGISLAGVDMISSDIGRSWKETDAMILEVNAGPGRKSFLHSRYFEHIISTRLTNDGRIPSFCVIGADLESDPVKKLLTALEYAGFVPGATDIHSLRIGNDWLKNHRMSSYHAGRYVLSDKRVTAFVQCHSDTSALRIGTACDRHDVLIIAGTKFEGYPETAASLRVQSAMVHALKQTTTGKTIDVSDSLTEIAFGEINAVIGACSRANSVSGSNT